LGVFRWGPERHDLAAELIPKPSSLVSRDSRCGEASWLLAIRIGLPKKGFHLLGEFISGNHLPRIFPRVPLDRVPWRTHFEI
jgi:hypothetical protein